MRLKKYKRFFKEYGYLYDNYKHYEKYGHVFRQFNEESLARVWQHSQYGCAIVSAFKFTKSLDENIKRHEDLKKQIRRVGLGFFEVDGVYVNDANIEEAELSVFIPFKSSKYDFDEFKDIMLQLCKRYEQDCVLIKYPDDVDNGKAVYLYANGHEEIIGYKVKFPAIARAFSRIRYGSHKGRKFKYEGYRVPSSFLEADILIKEGYLF